MKAKKKTNHLLEEADKIEQIPEEKNNGLEGQDEPINAKKPRKNRFLARLRKAWVRITGCMRCCCTSVQEERSAEEHPKPSGLNMEEELPEPSDINMEELQDPSEMNMEDSKDMFFTAKASTEDAKEENMEENQNNKTDKEEVEVVETEEENDAEYQRFLHLMHSQAYTSQEIEEEIEAECRHLLDLIYNQEEPCKVEDDAKITIKEDGEDGLKKADSAKESQRASCKMPGSSHISNRDNESSKGKEKEDNKGEDNIININKEREECRFKQMSSSKSSSLEEEPPKELYKTIKTSESGNREDRSDSCSIDNETVEELYNSIKASQRSNREDRSDSCSIDNETVEELYNSIKASQRGNSDDKSDSCSLEEETPVELYKSIKTSQSGNSHDEEPSTSDSCLEKVEQPGEETPSTVPLTLESFTFHQKLGTGNFGEVFLASDIIRKEYVAIKVSSKRLFIEDRHSFVERKILELSHESPFVIHGLAAFHTEKFVYYVLELATRGDLFDFIGNNFPLDTPTIQFIIAEVICGTQFLHKKGIIHRDLKSENILLTADGHIKITDFGLSAMGVYERIIENPRGTPQYMAPEMLKFHKHGRGVDYFAIGVILYDMYTGNFPFPGENAKEIYRSVLHHTPLYPEFLTPDTLDILQGLLCKDQDYRLGVIGDIKQHPFFSDIKWEDVEARRMEPPAIMTADFVDLNTDQTLRYIEKHIYIRPEGQKIFKELSFVCPDWSRHYHPVNNQAI